MLTPVHSQFAQQAPSQKAGIMPFTTVFCIFRNVGLGEAAKRNVGTGENQIPDMTSFASGDGWMKLPNGKILQYGRGAITPTLSTQTFTIPFIVWR
ncbi:hypothetical protein AU960_07440 [Salmonella enterica subsp. enterica serovar Chester]|nr:hypothetical protein [Salmonella enterica subsp. enterica serovar Chester]